MLPPSFEPSKPLLFIDARALNECYRCVTTHITRQKRGTCVHAAFRSAPTLTTRGTGTSSPRSGALAKYNVRPMQRIFTRICWSHTLRLLSVPHQVRPEADEDNGTSALCEVRTPSRFGPRKTKSRSFTFLSTWCWSTAGSPCRFWIKSRGNVRQHVPHAPADVPVDVLHIRGNGEDKRTGCTV